MTMQKQILSFGFVAILKIMYGWIQDIIRGLNPTCSTAVFSYTCFKQILCQGGQVHETVTALG